MRSWPKSAYLTILTLVMVFGVTLRWTYVETRDSYRAVGFNDGQIAQRAQVVENIQRLVSVAECRQLPNASGAVEFLSVKAESVYALVSADGCLQFCR